MKTRPNPIALPRIDELGRELIRTSRAQLILTLSAPWLAALAYALSASASSWVGGFVSVVVLSFVTYGSTSHDLVHRCLGLPKAINDLLLTLTELLTFRSGTAYRLAHLHHHRRYPHADDIEASVAGTSVVEALLQGPSHQLRLWRWAWKTHARHRNRLLVEAALVLLGLAAAVISAFHGRWWLPAYAALAIAGSWVFPVFTVFIPHDPTGSSPLTQTRLFRGWVFDVLAAGHRYHLEHHLYPMVPHHHWRALARKLDPVFERAGLEAHRVG
ncbi:MAG: fatty acid desaturase [Myxococcota bacterium]